MLGKAIAKFKNTINTDPPTTANAHLETSSELIRVELNYSKLQNTIDYLLSQSKVHEEAISQLITKVGNIQTDMPGPELLLKIMKIEKRVYDHDDRFMGVNANIDSMQTSFLMTQSTIGNHEYRLEKCKHITQWSKSKKIYKTN